MIDIPSRPGMRPDRYWTRTFPKAEWQAYDQASYAYWKYLADGVSALVPSLGLEYIGGGSIINVFYEDKSWAWLGGKETADDDGPYAFGVPHFVGGYRYAPETSGEIFTDLVLLRVQDVDDTQQVIDLLVSAARTLFTLPYTQSV